MMVLFLLRIQASFFLGIPNWVIDCFFFLFSFDLKGVMEKCVGCFLVYLCWGDFFSKKWGMRDILRKHIDALF